MCVARLIYIRKALTINAAPRERFSSLLARWVISNGVHLHTFTAQSVGKRTFHVHRGYRCTFNKKLCKKNKKCLTRQMKNVALFLTFVQPCLCRHHCGGCCFCPVPQANYKCTASNSRAAQNLSLDIPLQAELGQIIFTSAPDIFRKEFADHTSVMVTRYDRFDPGKSKHMDVSEFFIILKREKLNFFQIKILSKKFVQTWRELVGRRWWWGNFYVQSQQKIIQNFTVKHVCIVFLSG